MEILPIRTEHFVCMVWVAKLSPCPARMGLFGRWLLQQLGGFLPYLTSQGTIILFHWYPTTCTQQVFNFHQRPCVITPSTTSSPPTHLGQVVVVFLVGARKVNHIMYSWTSVYPKSQQVHSWGRRISHMPQGMSTIMVVETSFMVAPNQKCLNTTDRR